MAAFSDTPQFADGGGEMWERASDEALEAFEERVIADAKTAGLKLVVIGGLPPHDLKLGTLKQFMIRLELPEMPLDVFRRGVWP